MAHTLPFTLVLLFGLLDALKFRVTTMAHCRLAYELDFRTPSRITDGKIFNIEENGPIINAVLQYPKFEIRKS